MFSFSALTQTGLHAAERRTEKENCKKVDQIQKIYIINVALFCEQLSRRHDALQTMQFIFASCITRTEIDTEFSAEIYSDRQITQVR